MSKLRASTIRLNLDLMKLQRHMSTIQHDFLTTWQADILTLFIEVVFARCHRVLPGGYAVEEIESLSYETLTRVYRTAAKRIQKERLRRNFGLSAKYYFALQRYWEVRISLITFSLCFHHVDHTGQDCRVSKRGSLSNGVCVCSVVGRGEGQGSWCVRVLGEVVSIVLQANGRGKCCYLLMSHFVSFYHLSLALSLTSAMEYLHYLHMVKECPVLPEDPAIWQVHSVQFFSRSN